MKAMFLGPIALALALAGCGGKESFTVGGTVTGLKFNSLELTNGSDKIAVQPPADSTTAVSFQFPNSIDYGDEYEIAITKPPHQTCGTSGNSSLKGAAGYTQTIDVKIVCVVDKHKLKGTVTGVDVDGLTIVNGNGTSLAIPKGSDGFEYADQIESQSAYGLVVLDQPKGRVCSITNGTGKMGDADVTNIAITCVPK